MDNHSIPLKEIFRGITNYKPIVKMFTRNGASQNLKYFKEDDVGKDILEYLQTYSDSHNFE